MASSLRALGYLRKCTGRKQLRPARFELVSHELFHFFRRRRRQAFQCDFPRVLNFNPRKNIPDTGNQRRNHDSRQASNRLIGFLEQIVTQKSKGSSSEAHTCARKENIKCEFTG